MAAAGQGMAMILSDRVNTLGQFWLRHHGRRIHKIALDAGLTCPNRDGSKGTGGCTFCNNASFSPDADSRLSLQAQIAKASAVIVRRTGARHYVAYFQAYTNTYADVTQLETMYRTALAQPGVVGLSVGTRPDCVPQQVLELLARLRDEGWLVWLELGLQSAFDTTLARVRRGHSLEEYRLAARAARRIGLPLCTHLIVGLPGESEYHCHATLDTVLDLGVDGLKLHPLHVVRHTVLAQQWRRGAYQPLELPEYLRIAADMIERTPPDVIYHRVTATAPMDILLAPDWCASKWRVLNGIEAELRQRGTRQGDRS